MYFMAAIASLAPSFLFSFFFYCARVLRELHSFPTRRSSDLRRRVEAAATLLPRCLGSPAGKLGPSRDPRRSEEHTSELQSRFDLVCRLLLEKKNLNEQLAPAPYALLSE